MTNLGKLAYEAYSREAGGKSAWNEDDLPTWEEQSPEISSCWEAAAQAVAHRFTDAEDIL